MKAIAIIFVYVALVSGEAAVEVENGIDRRSVQTLRPTEDSPKQEIRKKAILVPLELNNMIIDDLSGDDDFFDYPSSSSDHPLEVVMLPTSSMQSSKLIRPSAISDEQINRVDAKVPDIREAPLLLSILANSEQKSPHSYMMAQVNTEKSLPSDKSPNVQGRPTTSVNTAFDARQGVQFLPTLNDPRYHYPPSAVNRVVQAPPVPPPVAPIDNSFQPAFPIFDSRRPPEPDFRPNFLFNGPMRSPFGAPMNLVRGPMFNPSDMLQPPPNLNTPFSVPNMPPPPPLFDLPPWLRPSLSIPPGPPPKPAFFPFPPDAFGPAGPPPKPAFFPLPPDAFGPAGPPPKPAFFQFPPDAVGPAGPQPKPGFLQFPPDAVGPAMAAPSEHQIFRHLISGTTGPLGPMFRPRMYKR